MRYRLLIVLAIILMVIMGCSPQAPAVKDGPASDTEAQAKPAPEPEPEQPSEKVLTIGAVHALTGEGAAYGVPLQKAIEHAVQTVNKDWESKGMKLVVEFEDGKCNGKDALTAMQNLVNLKGVRIVDGGTCSGETLGMAPFANDNGVVLFSPSASSPDITDAGEYIFRNYPADDAQARVLSEFIYKEGYTKVAILSENTDYPQALRNAYKQLLPEQGVQIVADEVVAPNAKDVRTEMLKIKQARPDAVILLPQTVPGIGVFAKQYIESGLEVAGFGIDIMNLAETVDTYGDQLEGFISPRVAFDEESNTAFQDLKTATGCDLGYYCAAAYDGIILLADILETCGDQDADCVKDALYATKDWKGPVGGSYTFDENGDIGGNFELTEISAGRMVRIG